MRIDIRQLQFSYPRSGFRFHVELLSLSAGSACAVIGPSGSGKSTLLKLVAGILPPESGEIHAGDAAVHRMTDRQRRNFRIQNIGFVFQDFELIEYLNVLENVILPYRINGSLTLRKEVADRARSLCESAGLSGKLKRSVRRLSQGEQQRVGICRALLSHPKLILADEPTGNLDPASKETILDTLLGQSADTGALLIMVTHDHNLLSRFNRVIDVHEFLKEA